MKRGPQYPIFIASHTQVQLEVFCQNNNIRIDDVIRVRYYVNAAGFHRDRPIYLLPDWWQGTEQGAIPLCEKRGWKVVHVTEAQVLTGTFQF